MLTFAFKKKHITSIGPKRHAPIASPISHSLHHQQAKVRYILRSGPPLQPKLTINPPRNKYEQEADCVAEQVMRMQESQVQQQSVEEEKMKIHANPLAKQIPSLLQRQVEPVHLLSQIAESIIQLQSKAHPHTWQKRLQQAQQLKKRKTTAARNQSRDIYKSLVLEATQSISAVKGLPVYKSPALKDIRWTWKLSGYSGAVTDNRRIFRHASDPWKWILFSPGAVNEDKAWTTGALIHELDHAAHGYQIFLKWKAHYPKGSAKAWKQYWVSHYGRFTEAPIRLTNMGILSALSGLPATIRPSMIEFRAYANQFVNFFHKYSLKSQALNAKGVILFYPLKKQAVKVSISDPTMNLDAARKKVLDYFQNPPGKTPSEKQILQVRIADEMAYAVVLRPRSDQSTIKKDFKPIFDFIKKLKANVVIDAARGLMTNEWKVKRKKARRNYKPQ